MNRYLAFMYPGGAGHYTDGDTPRQSARMELLAKLYDRAIHPQIPATHAQRIRAGAADLPADLDAAAGPAATVALLERVRTALARVAQFELANLKRMFKVDGMNEAEIHEIIPDRSVAKKPPKAP